MLITRGNRFLLVSPRVLRVIKILNEMIENSKFQKILGNFGKFPENLGNILGNLGKIPDNIGRF